MYPKTIITKTQIFVGAQYHQHWLIRGSTGKMYVICKKGDFSHFRWHLKVSIVRGTCILR